MLFPRLKCVCAPARHTPKQVNSGASIVDKIHTNYVMLGECSLKQFVLSGPEQFRRKSDVCQYIVLKWPTGAWDTMLIKEENAKRKSLTALNLYNVIALISINLSIHAVFIYIWFLLDLFCRLLLTWTVMLVDRHEKTVYLISFVLLNFSVCFTLFLCSCSCCIL